MIGDRYTPEAHSVAIAPHLFVVFGGTGDLARGKLLPALYRLLRSRDFSDAVQVLGVASRDITDDEYRSMVAQALADASLSVDEEWLGRSVHYQSLRRGFEALAGRKGRGPEANQTRLESGRLTRQPPSPIVLKCYRVRAPPRTAPRIRSRITAPTNAVRILAMLIPLTPPPTPSAFRTKPPIRPPTMPMMISINSPCD